MKMHLLCFIIVYPLISSYNTFCTHFPENLQYPDNRCRMRELSVLPQCKPTSEGLILFIDGPLSITVIMGGIVGIIYCMQILIKTSINTGMQVSLTVLFIWDMILLLTSLFHHALWATLNVFQIYMEPWDRWITILGALSEFAHINSTWMLLEVSATRFFAVSRPFQKHATARKHRTKYQLRVALSMIKIPCILTIIAAFVIIPCIYEYDLTPCKMNDQLPHYQREETLLLRNKFYVIGYRMIFIALLKTFIPFVIITFLTINTVLSMRASMKSRADILRQQGRGLLFESDRDKTKCLQTISILLLGKFLVFRCWPMAIELIRARLLADSRDAQISHIAEFLLLLNSATNSLIYVVLKSLFETRRLRRTREKQRRMVAQHAEQVLCIGKALAGNHLLHLKDVAKSATEEDLLSKADSAYTIDETGSDNIF